MYFNFDNFKMLATTFLISVFLGPIIIPMLKQLEIGQSIRKAGPKTHYKKSGTPTMGGIIFFLSLIIGILIFMKPSKSLLVMLLSTFLFGLIGFIDDFLIVVRKDNEGLKPKQKLLGQFVVAFLISVYVYLNWDTSLIVPFSGGKTLNMGIIYIPFMVFVMVGTVNSVNLTDGLDGLATSVTSIVLLFFVYYSIKLNNIDVSAFSLLLFGSILGFLKHNMYPAKIFMGDTGSMALGGAVSSIAMILNLPLLIPIIGGIYFAEALSVIIQVLSFKYRNKRVFLMSPLHHHYEQKGWHETKVAKTFIIITIILAFIAVIGVR